MGAKRLDYLDFKEVYQLIKQGEHLTEPGQTIIRQLKAGMNKARTHLT